MATGDGQRLHLSSWRLERSRSKLSHEESEVPTIQSKYSWGVRVDGTSASSGVSNGKLNLASLVSFLFDRVEPVEI